MGIRLKISSSVGGTFVEEFVDEPVDLEAELVNPDRPAQGLLNGVTKGIEGQAELYREELELGDLARRAAEPPFAFVERDGAAASDGLSIRVRGMRGSRPTA